jgi:hypothetical protein
MISLGLYPDNIDSIKGKTWNLNDQISGFTGPFVSSTHSTATLIEPLIQPLNLPPLILKAGHIIAGQDLTLSLLNESLEYFQKALYNFSSQYLLAKNGYKTWAQVTNYYSSYFSVFSLLALQGRIISRIRLDGIGQTPCLLHPIDFRNHQYVLTTKETQQSTHKLPWRKYYEIYDNYQNLTPQFEIIQSKHFVLDSIDESDNRNKINYKIYEGFQEIINVNNLTDFKNQYLGALASPIIGESEDKYFIALHSLATDPELMYFARSALRLLLIKNIFHKIGDVNPQFKAEFESRIPIWELTMFDSYNPKQNYYEDFAQTFLG